MEPIFTDKISDFYVSLPDIFQQFVFASFSFHAFFSSAIMKYCCQLSVINFYALFSPAPYRASVRSFLQSCYFKISRLRLSFKGKNFFHAPMLQLLSFPCNFFLVFQFPFSCAACTLLFCLFPRFSRMSWLTRFPVPHKISGQSFSGGLY